MDSNVMMNCPQTGEPLAVGFKLDRHSFKVKGEVHGAVVCRHCHEAHAYSDEDLWLEPLRH